MSKKKKNKKNRNKQNTTVVNSATANPTGKTLLSMFDESNHDNDQDQNESKHSRRKWERYGKPKQDEKDVIRLTDYIGTAQNYAPIIVGKEEAGEVTVEPVFDLDKFEEELNNAEALVKEGKFKTLKKMISLDMFAQYANTYLNDAANQVMDDNIRKVIILGKSVYEYGPEDFEILPNTIYDGALAKYLSHDGNVEPVGIIPKGSKYLKKSKINYPSLHNNMDKAYILEDTDTVPLGVKETDSIESFIKRVYHELKLDLSVKIQLMLSPKLDGVSLNGTIHGNKLENPQTRGDSVESVSVIGLNHMKISDVQADEDFGIQYECFVTEKNRIKASEYLGMEKPYVSCRHAAAGIIHRLSTMEDEKLANMLSFYPINSEGLDGTYIENVEYILNFGKVPLSLSSLTYVTGKITKENVADRLVIEGTYQELMDQIETYYHILEKARPSLGYAIDGMVITVADEDHQQKIGRIERTNKWQIAMKFDPATAVGIAKDISLDTGRKGFRTIQVELKEPVFLDGVRYDHVPILSAELYDKLNLRVNSEVQIHRVGDVIPSITVLKEGAGAILALPMNCPECGGPLIRKAKKLYCSNSKCPGNVKGRFVGFFERIRLDKYGDSFANELYNMDCRTLGDVLVLTKEDMKENSSSSLSFPKNLKNQLSTLKDYEILAALGLPGIGPAKAKTILKECKFSELAALEYNEAHRIAVKAVGNDQATTLTEYMVSNEFKSDILAFSKQMGSHQITKDFDAIKRVGHSGGNLKEETVQKINSMGYEVTDGRSFDFLIVADKSSNSKKVQIAKANNIQMMTEDEFIDLANAMINEQIMGRNVEQKLRLIMQNKMKVAEPEYQLPKLTDQRTSRSMEAAHHLLNLGSCESDKKPDEAIPLNGTEADEEMKNEVDRKPTYQLPKLTDQRISRSLNAARQLLNCMKTH